MYLEKYFEDTKDIQNTYIDINLFKQVAFDSGMPLILVDLITYLCGGFHEQKKLAGQVAKAVHLLDERVPNQKKPVKTTGNFLGRQESLLLGDSKKKNFLAEILKSSVNQNLKQMIPPLKTYPALVESDHSIDSDDPRVEHIKADYLTRLAEVTNEINTLAHDKTSHQNARDFFKKLARVQDNMHVSWP